MASPDQEKKDKTETPMFAEVLFAKPIGKNKDLLTYEIPKYSKIGQIVEAPVRKRKEKGIVFRILDKKPDFKTRPIERIIENAPHLSLWQIELIKWIADYYFCPQSRALKLFLPIAFIKKKTIKPWIEEKTVHESSKMRHKLTLQQQEVLKNFQETDKKITLLHGITGSGKTEIYLHAADQALEKGQQVLILIPEISLTPQTVQRFQDHFQEKIAVIHSQLTDKQKEREWLSIYKQEAKIIIGSRSALFAPYQNLGLIIVDEEHEPSYKQDQSPRYNTVDVAKKMSELLDIKILLGSATPSLESYYQAKQGTYHLLKLKNRAKDGTRLPTVNIVDLREEIKKRNFSIFSELLQKKLTQKLGNKEQSILFLNRRGAASAIICRSCGFVSRCSNCETALTYHKKLSTEDIIFNAERLVCHHCGRIERVPEICPNCESPYIRYIGVGTQRIESELEKNFPQSKVLRADRDTVFKKDQFKTIYLAFKNHEADILVGTQMIALGLHLPKVSLVGVILAELTLTLPNFRSSERTFQLLTQVAGRAGRGEKAGEVIIQSYLPNHYVIQKAASHDYEGFYEVEIEFRKTLGYPPFTQLIRLTFSHKNERKCREESHKIFTEFKKLDPENDYEITLYPAFIPRLQNNYRWHILINGKEPTQLLKKILPHLSEEIKENLKIDVDPISTI